MEIFEINSFVILMIGQIIFLCIFLLLRFKKDRFLQESTNEIFVFIRESIADVKISFNKPLYSIFIPITIVIFIFYVFRHFVQQTEVFIHPNFETLLFILILTSLTGPIAEEIIQCFTISVVYIGEKCIFQKLSIQEPSFRLYGPLIIILILDAFYMAYFHENKTENSFIIRTVCFIIFGFFYIVNNRNIVPPIIAHCTWNFFVVVDSIS